MNDSALYSVNTSKIKCVLLNKNRHKNYLVSLTNQMAMEEFNIWLCLHQQPPLVSMPSSVSPGYAYTFNFEPNTEVSSQAVGNVADKRKSVTYAPSVNASLSPDLPNGPGMNGHSFARPAGAKSMPASRRTSASSHDEELAIQIQGLSLANDRSTRASPIPTPVSASALLRGNGRYGDDEGARYASTYNAGMMLDEQLDQEMHSKYRSDRLVLVRKLYLTWFILDAMRNLPTSDDDKYNNNYPGKVRDPFVDAYHFLTSDRFLRLRQLWILLTFRRPPHVHNLQTESLTLVKNHLNGRNLMAIHADQKAPSPGRIDEMSPILTSHCPRHRRTSFLLGRPRQRVPLSFLNNPKEESTHIKDQRPVEARHTACWTVCLQQLVLYLLLLWECPPLPHIFLRTLERLMLKISRY